jgi:hypothetical protein
MQCPACAETIAEGTSNCPHCRSEVVTFAQNLQRARQALGRSQRLHASQPVRLLFILGGLGIGLALLMGVASVLIFLDKKTELARFESQMLSEERNCRGNLQRIALALHSYHDTYGSFPPAIARNSAGEPMHSWRVLILPFLDGGPRDLDYRMDEPWDSPHNRRVTAKTPPVFRCPGNTNGAKFGTTHYVAIDGPHSVLNSEKPARLQDIIDGPGVTMMVVEGRDPAVHWAQPRDLEIAHGTAFGPDGMSSAHGGVFHAAMADGTVRIIPYQAGLEGLRGLSTIDGGETVEAFR